MHLLNCAASSPWCTCVGAACQCSGRKDSSTGTSLGPVWRRLGDIAPNLC